MALPRKENGKIDVKSMWEYKFTMGIIRFFLYMFFALYLTVAAQSAWKWAKLKWVGGDFTVATLAENIEPLLDNNQEVLAAQLIQTYPYQITDDVLDALAPVMPKMNAIHFFAFSKRYLQLDNPDRALFWNAVGRFRLRYDAYRCDDFAPDLMADRITEIVQGHDILPAIFNISEADAKRHLYDSLKWAEENRAINTPRYFCKIIEKRRKFRNIPLVEKDRWEGIYNALLFLGYLNTLEEDQTIDDLPPSILSLYKLDDIDALLASDQGLTPDVLQQTLEDGSPTNEDTP